MRQKGRGSYRDTRRGWMEGGGRRKGRNKDKERGNRFDGVGLGNSGRHDMGWRWRWGWVGIGSIHPSSWGLGGAKEIHSWGEWTWNGVSTVGTVQTHMPTMGTDSAEYAGPTKAARHANKKKPGRRAPSAWYVPKLPVPQTADTTRLPSISRLRCCPAR